MSEGDILKIVVCVKMVEHVYAPANFDRKKEEIDSECLVNIINPYDEYALEMALQLKRRSEGSCQVFVVTYGDDQSKEMLSYCLSLGADDAYLIRGTDFPPMDPWNRAFVLSCGIEKIGFDLVFAGKQAIDDNFGLVGGYLANFLKINWISNISDVEKFDANNKGIVCRKISDKTKIERIRAAMPVMLLTEKGGIGLSYPSLRGIFYSRKKQIIEWNRSDLDLQSYAFAEKKLINALRTTPPKPKPAFTVDSSLSAADRMKMIMSGGLAKKSDTKILEGKIEDTVPKIVKYLIDNISPF